MIDTESVVAIDDSLRSRLTALGEIVTAHHGLRREAAADLDLLIALCADSPAGAAFLAGGADDLIAGLRGTIDALLGDLARTDTGLSGGMTTITTTDEGVR
ncbi:hypothetical protein [Jongsikchunia kroppenstedtii]|uniref:hypothetical protein n=1 Tax=Jongsikchunia kroppenstedtii TaxID=1121721 RepID=UPI00037B8CA1|nr:hypothetical protein [Jongsikchunia kroppenstedtii]